MKRLYMIHVRGRNHTWSWYCWGTQNDARLWIEDGLDVYRVLNVIPNWVVRLGLTRVWVFLEDLFTGQLFENLGRKA